MDEINSLKEPSSGEEETRRHSYGIGGNLLKHTTIPGAGPPAKRAKYSPPFEDSCDQGERTQVEEKNIEHSVTAGTDKQKYDSGMILYSSTKLENESKAEEKYSKRESEYISHTGISTSGGENSSEEESICISSRTGSEILDDSGDDRMDASNLVLSVIKTKVDIQTMKMCLQHNSDAFSGRASSLSVHPQPQPTEGAQGGSELRTRHLPTDVETEPSLTPWPSEFPDESSNLCSCSTSSCDVCRSRREHQLDSHRGAEDRSSNHLEHWQDQHTAKAIVDNAINRTIEEMVIAPDVSSPTGVQDQGQQIAEEEERAQQRLQERLEPVINQLTQASELVFARNIEQSKSASFNSRDEIESPVEGGIDQK